MAMTFSRSNSASQRSHQMSVADSNTRTFKKVGSRHDLSTSPLQNDKQTHQLPGETAEPDDGRMVSQAVATHQSRHRSYIPVPALPSASQTPATATMTMSSTFAADMYYCQSHATNDISAACAHLVHHIVIAIWDQPNLAEQPPLLDVFHMLGHPDRVLRAGYFVQVRHPPTHERDHSLQSFWVWLDVLGVEVHPCECLN
jgi:hypothetical protein